MNEDIMRILEMVKDGKLTPAEGEKLMSAVGEEVPVRKKAKKKSTLRIRINTNESDEEDGNEQSVVNVNVPLVLAKKLVGLASLTPKDVKSDLSEKGIDLDSIDLQGLIEAFEDGDITEELVNIETKNNKGETTSVKIYVD